MDEVRGLVEAYVAETSNALSVGEVIDEYAIIPILERGELIGFFGVFISDNDAGMAAIIGAAYIKPEHRDSRGAKLRKHFYALTNELKKQGVVTLQVDASRAIGLIIEKYGGFKPVSYRYLAPIGEWPRVWSGRDRKKKDA